MGPVGSYYKVMTVKAKKFPKTFDKPRSGGTGPLPLTQS